MDCNRYRIKTCILEKNETDLVDLLNRGFNPNLEGGWPIRLAARHGLHSIVKLLIQYGANPHLISEAGFKNYIDASTGPQEFITFCRQILRSNRNSNVSYSTTK
ncbi:unnamed protein product [Parnassius mnemosyne]|uniref:Ankyrin repeat protein n=1 Tax=Parnassius mnemosyne TaxID=213953 RepID=A0AAV1M8E5_9NEOP